MFNVNCFAQRRSEETATGGEQMSLALCDHHLLHHLLQLFTLMEGNFNNTNDFQVRCLFKKAKIDNSRVLLSILDFISSTTARECRLRSPQSADQTQITLVNGEYIN